MLEELVLNEALMDFKPYLVLVSGLANALAVLFTAYGFHADFIEAHILAQW